VKKGEGNRKTRIERNRKNSRIVAKIEERKKREKNRKKILESSIISTIYKHYKLDTILGSKEKNLEKLSPFICSPCLFLSSSLILFLDMHWNHS
jgi:hypothetical protein